MFTKASAYAQQTCDRWYVVSAKHGLIPPGCGLQAHDMRLGTNHRTSLPIHQWCNKVQAQLELGLAGVENVKLIVLAGEQYQQLGWLTAQLSGDAQPAG